MQITNEVCHDDVEDEPDDEHVTTARYLSVGRAITKAELRCQLPVYVCHVWDGANSSRTPCTPSCSE